MPDYKYRPQNSISLAVSAASSLTGFVMVEQVKSVDFNARKAKFVEKAAQELIDDVLDVIYVCVK